MKTWLLTDPDSRTWSKKNKKALKNTLNGSVVENVASNFADLVVVGERIKVGIRRGKFAQTNSTVGFAKKTTSEKKKGETNAVLIEPTFPQTKINMSSYLTQMGSRLVVTQPTPYIPPSQL
ncbi:hypothetical protein CR513_24679, partial [Mucuna pruriens]